MNTELLALHGLCVKKAAEAAEVARIMGHPADEIEKALEAAAASGDAMGAKGKYTTTTTPTTTPGSWTVWASSTSGPSPSSAS
jgi:2-methylcitrate dehydratase PrpD